MNILQTERLTLLPQVQAHADEMYVVLVDPALYVHENAPPASVAWLRTRFARLETRRSPDGHERWLNWVLRAVDDALIGYVQGTIHADGSASIGYVLGSAHWGRGLASEAVAAMLAELASRYRVGEFHAVLKRDNGRSLRLLERQGFVPGGAAALAAHPVDADELLMTLTRP